MSWRWLASMTGMPSERQNLGLNGMHHDGSSSDAVTMHVV